ncbi:MAG: hypothetical protein QOH26_1923 [Actinomycetota bacterium]|nr:hypothetical protein [Actinomycetota bacterium]
MTRWRRIRGWASLILIYAITLVLWAAARPASVWFDGLAASLHALGVAAGLVGATAFAANLVLGARLRGISRWFGGLQALYAVHRANGRFAYLLVLGHVVLIVASRWAISPRSALDLFTPGAGRTILLGEAAFLAMTIAIVLTLYVRLKHELFVYVQRAFGVIFGVAALHVFMSSAAKAGSSALTYYLLFVTIAGLGAFVYRSLFGNVLVKRFDYLVTGARELDPAVVEITMEPMDGPLRPFPGQFVYATFYSGEFEAQFHPVSVSTSGRSATIVLRPGDVRDQFHPFSLTSAPDDPHLKLAVKAVGTFTKALHLLKPGAYARIEGPYGEFSYLNVPHERQKWVAGGIGITPFLSMSRSLRSGGGYDIHLFYGVKTRAEAYFMDELEEIARSVDGFALTLVPEDEEGFITARLLLLEGNDDANEADFLICGPPAMVAALDGQLRDAGVPPSSIHAERFGFGPRSGG